MPDVAVCVPHDLAVDDRGLLTDVLLSCVFRRDSGCVLPPPIGASASRTCCAAGSSVLRSLSELQQAPGVQVEFVQHQPAADLPNAMVALEGVYDGLELSRVDACQAQEKVVLAGEPAPRHHLWNLLEAALELPAVWRPPPRSRRMASSPVR